MIDTTSLYPTTICGLLLLMGVNISDCQLSSEDRHQHCSTTRPNSFGIHPPSSGDYDSLECSSLSSMPTDYEIFTAIKTSLNDWNRNQKFSPTNSIDNNNGRLSRTKREQHSSLKGVEDDSQQTQMPQQVCYEHFGCFRHKGPFDYLNTLPGEYDILIKTYLLLALFSFA